MKRIFVLAAAACAVAGARAAEVSGVQVRQAWPADGRIAVTYTVSGIERGAAVDVTLAEVSDASGTIAVPEEAVAGPRRCLAADGTYTFTIDPAKVPHLRVTGGSPSLRVRLACAASALDPDERLYMIVDLKQDNSVTYLTRADILSGRYGAFETKPAWIHGSTVADADGCLIWTGVTNNPAYMTTKLVLRRIPMAGKSYRQSRNGQASTPYAARTVSFDHDFWAGVFEVTEAQFICVHNGTWNSTDTRPKCLVTWRGLCGDTQAAKETADTEMVDEDAWFYKAQRKTGLRLCLPTEAEWECAARAGVDTHYSDGVNTDLMSVTLPHSNVGRVQVGSFLPNAWGLYDVQGNVGEWTLDWRYQQVVNSSSYTHLTADDAANPRGLTRTEALEHYNPPQKIVRGMANSQITGTRYGGGCFSRVRLNQRDGNVPTQTHENYGFRVFLTEEAAQ